MPRTQKKRLPKSSFYRDLGRSIRNTRNAAGKSQTEAAEALDVTFQQFQKYENGSNRIPIDKLASLALFLQVPLSQFVNDDASVSKSPFLALMNQYSSKECQALLKHFTAIEDDQMRVAILDIAKASAALKR
jgi:transcriptional regulator with XRE-family HTH domain